MQDQTNRGRNHLFGKMVITRGVEKGSDVISGAEDIALTSSVINKPLYGSMVRRSPATTTKNESDKTERVHEPLRRKLEPASSGDSKHAKW